MAITADWKKPPSPEADGWWAGPGDILVIEKWLLSDKRPRPCLPPSLWNTWQAFITHTWLGQETTEPLTPLEPEKLLVSGKRRGGPKDDGVPPVGLQIFLSGADLLTTCCHPKIKLHCGIHVQGPPGPLCSMSLGACHRSEETHGTLLSLSLNQAWTLSLRAKGCQKWEYVGQERWHPVLQAPRILLSTSCARC